MVAIGDRTWAQSSPEIDRLQHAAEPLSAQPVGKPQEAPLGVFLSYKAALFIEAYLQANPINEMAGFLVGYASRSETRPFIVVTGAIEAREVTQVDGGVRFTQETWTYLKAIWQREYPDTHVLGWFHSQPGRGVSLSDLNRFTHHRFFERSWQVCFVVDPLQNTSRFYRRAGRKLVPLEDFYLLDHNDGSPGFSRLDAGSGSNDGPPAERESAATLDDELPKALDNATSPPDRPWHGIGVFLLLLIVLTSTIVISRMLWFSPSFQEAEARLTEIETLLQKAHSEQRDLEEILNQLRLATDMELHGEGMQGNIQPSTLPTSQAGTNADGNGSQNMNSVGEGFEQYVVETGDTLWNISERLFGSPFEYAQIAELNRLSDPNHILPGTVLLLPKSTDER